jgi:hypothetical protein
MAFVNDDSFDDIFTQYYTQFRADSDIPTSTDDEYTVGMRMANEAINRWANFDGTYWKELFTTLQLDGGGTQTITTGTTTYLAPGNFKEAGGFVRVKDANGNDLQTYAIIDPQEAQFKAVGSDYCYFTKGQTYYSTGTASQSTTTVTGSGTTFTSAMVGMQIQYASGEVATITGYTSATSLTVSPTQTVSSTTYKIVNPGYTLTLGSAPTSNLNGLDIDYIYYKYPSRFTTGTSRTEMSDSYFIVHRMLANQFRAARNPYYTSAKSDAENALKQMQIDNNSGTWSNPWEMADRSGTSWGQ